jgi:adenylate cyclase
VTEELEGRGERIKAYSIATEVLGRPQEFDAQQDSIVRVEIGRLRQSLERYYLTAGVDAPVVISIPKGQYRPVFTPTPPLLPAPQPKRARPWLRNAAVALGLFATLGAILAVGLIKFAPQPEKPQARRGPVIAIAPFFFRSDKEGQSYIADGLQSELAASLSEFRWLAVVPLTEEAPQRMDAPATVSNVDFLVRASLRVVGDQVATTVLLLDARTGAVRWTNRYDVHLKAGEIMAMQRDIVSKIAVDVGNPFGIVADIEGGQLALDNVRSEEAFNCQLRAFQYFKRLKSTDYARAWSCFDAIRTRGGLDSNSFAMLSLLTLEPLNARVTGRSAEDMRTEALALAKTAYDLNNFDSLPRVARYTVALCAGDIETFRRIGRSVVKDNPNNPIALADFGGKLILGANDPSEGMPLIERARALSQDLTHFDIVAVATDALRRREFDDRPRLRLAAAQSDSAAILLLDLALAAARGDAAEIARAKGRLSDIGYEDQKSVASIMDAACWSKEMRELVNGYVTLGFKSVAAQQPRE